MFSCSKIEADNVSSCLGECSCPFPPHSSGSGSFPTILHCSNIEKNDDLAYWMLLVHGRRTVTTALRHIGNEMKSHFSHCRVANNP